MTRLSDIISRDEWTREDLAYAVGLEEGDPERELLSEAAHRVKAERVGLCLLLPRSHRVFEYLREELPLLRNPEEPQFSASV